ncbi:MAG: DEAD/DEAH box helicase [Thermomicrobiales bacterium]
MRSTARRGTAAGASARKAVAALSAPDAPGGGSGVIVLPCGAGKTLVGIGASVALGCWTLVLCPNSSSVQQWVAAYQRFTDLSPDAIGEYRAPRRHLRPVTATTYQQLTARGSRTGEDLPHLNLLGSQDWGLIIFDEAHLLPADVFRLAADLASRRRLGLTATPVREDGREVDLAALIGPVRYDVPWATLEAQGWIAPVECIEVRVPLADAPGDLAHRAAATAPEKWPVVRSLARRHRGEGVLVIGQYLDQLAAIAERLKPLIGGATPRADREGCLRRASAPARSRCSSSRASATPASTSTRASQSKSRATSARARRKPSASAACCAPSPTAHPPASTRSSPTPPKPPTPPAANVSSSNRATATASSAPGPKSPGRGLHRPARVRTAPARKRATQAPARHQSCFVREVRPGGRPPAAMTETTPCPQPPGPIPTPPTRVP